MNDKYVFFHNGPFSQWYPSKFVIDKIKYTCAEQYMMYKKALLFNDLQTANAILKTNQPKQQKALGRKVKNFNEQKWNNEAKNIVYNGNKAKFTQNKDLNKLLQETLGLILVEASPTDRIWGIGLGKDDPNRFDETKWLGKNWLGYTLTKVRIDLFGK